MAAGRHTGTEQGSALVEVIVSAVLLVVLAIGIFPLLDASSSAGASARARAVASAMASDTIEQMRAMPVTTLAFYSDSHDTTVRGVRYHVTSKADWMRDTSGDVTCALDTVGVEYLRLRTTITSPAMSGAPVTMESLVTPPNGAFDPSEGSLAVRTLDAAGDPLAGVSVSGGGRSGVSGSDGCVVLVLLPGGTVNITAQAAGYVTTSGDSVANVAATVVPGRTSSTSVQLDRPTTVNTSFDTVRTSGSPTSAATVTAVSAATPPLAGPVVETLNPAASSTSLSLFPFHDGYGLYAGDCAGNDPTRYNASHYQSFPSALVSPTPGATVAATVRVPSLWVRTQRSTGVGFAASRVTVSPNTGDSRMTGCTGKWTLTASSSGDAIGALPFGAYTVCAADSTGRRATGTVVSSAATGASAPQLTLTVPSFSFTYPGCP